MSVCIFNPVNAHSFGFQVSIAVSNKTTVGIVEVTILIEASARMRQVSAHSLASRSELRTFTFIPQKSPHDHPQLFIPIVLFVQQGSPLYCLRQRVTFLSFTWASTHHHPSWPTNNLLCRPRHRNHHNHRKPDPKSPLLHQQNHQRHRTDNPKRRRSQQSRRSKNQTPRVLLQTWTPRSSRISI